MILSALLPIKLAGNSICLSFIKWDVTISQNHKPHKSQSIRIQTLSKQKTLWSSCFPLLLETIILSKQQNISFSHAWFTCLLSATQEQTCQMHPAKSDGEQWGSPWIWRLLSLCTAINHLIHPTASKGLGKMFERRKNLAMDPYDSVFSS